MAGMAKLRRKELQANREAANRKLRAEGRPTPWQEARANRKLARKPLQDAYRVKHYGKKNTDKVDENRKKVVEL